MIGADLLTGDCSSFEKTDFRFFSRIQIEDRAGGQRKAYALKTWIKGRIQQSS